MEPCGLQRLCRVEVGGGGENPGGRRGTRPAPRDGSDAWVATAEPRSCSSRRASLRPAYLRQTTPGCTWAAGALGASIQNKSGSGKCESSSCRDGSLLTGRDGERSADLYG
ncbi:unnamed protein product [Coccothraustes coccothraustes]